jgi:hypothetical protein
MADGATFKTKVPYCYVEFSLAGVPCETKSSSLSQGVAEVLCKELLSAGATDIQIKRSQS